VATEKSAVAATVVATVGDVLPANAPAPGKEAVMECVPTARLLTVMLATPMAFSGDDPSATFPSLNMMFPVGVPPIELIDAVMVSGEPWATLAGAERFIAVAMPVTCISVFELLGRKLASPLNFASMAWIPIPASAKVRFATPFITGAAPWGTPESETVTIPVGVPGLLGPAATVAVTTVLELTVVEEIDTLVLLTKPVEIAANKPP